MKMSQKFKSSDDIGINYTKASLSTKTKLKHMINKHKKCDYKDIFQTNSDYAQIYGSEFKQKYLYNTPTSDQNDVYFEKCLSSKYKNLPNVHKSGKTKRTYIDAEPCVYPKPVFDQQSQNYYTYMPQKYVKSSVYSDYCVKNKPISQPQYYYYDNYGPESMVHPKKVKQRIYYSDPILHEPHLLNSGYYIPIEEQYQEFPERIGDVQYPSEVQTNVDHLKPEQNLIDPQLKRIESRTGTDLRNDERATKKVSIGSQTKELEHTESRKKKTLGIRTLLSRSTQTYPSKLDDRKKVKCETKSTQISSDFIMEMYPKSNEVVVYDNIFFAIFHWIKNIISAFFSAFFNYIPDDQNLPIFVDPITLRPVQPHQVLKKPKKKTMTTKIS